VVAGQPIHPNVVLPCDSAADSLSGSGYISIPVIDLFAEL